MRVCFISHSNSPWAPYYTRYFQERGHEVHLISFHPKTIPGITMHYVGAQPADGRLPKWIYLWRVPRVRRLLRKLRPDVVMATYVRSNGLVGAMTKCSPLVVSSRGVIDYEFGLPPGINERLLRWIAGRADLLHASSDELAEGFERSGVPRDKFTVIPVGTDTGIFTPREGPRPPGPPRLICTRKHDALYDNETIIRALARLRSDGLDFEFRFTGSGSRIDANRRLVAELGLNDGVEFRGDVAHEQVPGELRWADLYVSAAESDGAPSSLFEAMSCKLFPVVTDVRANRDWINHRNNGYLFRFHDDGNCAEGLRFALTHLEIVSQALEENRRMVAERLDRAAGLAKLEKLLEKAAGMRRRA
jgi:glycosyltransferase involved in cell wall biosynthesis